MKLTNLIKSLLFVLLLTGMAHTASAKKLKPSKNVFCFYYNWYGSPEFDGKDVHWTHGVIKQSPNDPSQPPIPGGGNLSSNFYPKFKNYSSRDPKIVSTHMKMMADAGIGVVVLTWWRNSDLGLASIPLIMDEAHKYGLQVCFHLEPYGGRTAASVRVDLGNLLKDYGNHPAFYRTETNQACFFIYDSYLINFKDWTELLTPEGSMTIRNTPLDAVMIGLWVKAGEEEFFKKSGVDGFYTYFAADGFTYGSSTPNWKHMQDWATANNKIFIPSVGPGYIDTRVRPWNTPTIRDRENGAYYDRMFQSAIDCGAKDVAITSFNEWHEGTQIEPAVPFECPEFKYLDYRPLKPDHYLKQTKELVERFEAAKQNSKK